MISVETYGALAAKGAAGFGAGGMTSKKLQRTSDKTRGDMRNHPKKGKLEESKHWSETTYKQAVYRVYVKPRFGI